MFYFLLGLLALGFLILLIISFTKLDFNKWFFWKYWLMLFLKFQMVAMFTLLSVHLPCSVYYFFD